MKIEDPSSFSRYRIFTNHPEKLDRKKTDVLDDPSALKCIFQCPLPSDSPWDFQAGGAVASMLQSVVDQFREVPVFGKHIRFPQRTTTSMTGWWFHFCFNVPFHIWDVILPIDELIFFKMLETC
jgi:hypothetical protein